jgi:hypothetical protein
MEKSRKNLILNMKKNRLPVRAAVLKLKMVFHDVVNIQVTGIDTVSTQQGTLLDRYQNFDSPLTRNKLIKCFPNNGSGGIYLGAIDDNGRRLHCVSRQARSGEKIA